MRYLLASAILMTVMGCVSPVAAQGGAVKQNILRQKALRQQKIQQEKLRQQKQQKLMPLPAPIVERFLQMSPEDRERELAKLPPERRQQVEQRLNRLEQLPANQREELQDLYPAFQNLRPVRRQAVRQEIQLLRQLRPVERRDRLNNNAGDFSPEEMDILRRVAGIPDGQ